MTAKHGLRVGIIAILHTLNGRLEFNSHVHTMVSAGGLRESPGCWVPSVYCDRNRLMKFRRDAVINLLHTAHLEGLLRSQLISDQLTAMLIGAGQPLVEHQDSVLQVEYTLLKAGRYLRRPPIAQRRITYVGKRLCHLLDQR